MTMAVCLRCGSEKFGAFVPCADCNYTPATAEDQAKSMILTDHFLGPSSLREAASAIKTGETVSFPADRLRSMIERIETGPSQEEMFANWSQAATEGRRQLRLLGAVAVLVLGAAGTAYWIFV
jgi:hypothetical protein